MFCFCLLSILVETFRDNGDFTHLFIPMSLVFTFYLFIYFILNLNLWHAVI